jgi:hypothetical protein
LKKVVFFVQSSAPEEFQETLNSPIKEQGSPEIPYCELCLIWKHRSQENMIALYDS